MHRERPLGKNLEETDEFAKLAADRGMSTIIGLQGRQAPVDHVIRSLLNEDQIGNPLSIMVTATGYNFGEVDLHTLAYLSDINFGGNLVTIHFLYPADTIMHAVGQLAWYSVVLETARKRTLLRNKSHTYEPTNPGNEPTKIIESVERTSHDQVLIQGHLENSVLSHSVGGSPSPERRR